MPPVCTSKRPTASVREMCCNLLQLFFSRRGRHTRCLSDWSSDVCSSDLDDELATGRELIIKFEGCYHGHADSFLVKAGSGVATLGLPDSPGVPPELARLTLTAPFNDDRSEERRVGKECRERSAPHEENKA